MNAIIPITLILGLAGSLHAGPRTSASYSIAAETSDAGGRRCTSANYTHDGSIGLIAGVSTVASPAGIMKTGYLGQLTAVTGLIVSADAPTVDEAATLQLSAMQSLDDATFHAVPVASVTWSILSGPLTGIDANGLATAGLVYQNTTATVEGVFAGDSGAFDLTVLDTMVDNFGTYAGDGVDDDWQVQYFGQPPNADAGPLIDADGDGHNNAFEFIAGLIPTDAGSVFDLRIEPVPGEPAQKNVIFSPRFADRSYTVKASSSLLPATFATLGRSTISDNAEERTVTDLGATGATKFYRVEITK
jgi:hypothetical protein